MPPRPASQFPYLFSLPYKILTNPSQVTSSYIGVLFTLPVLLYALKWSSIVRAERLRWFAFLASISGAAMLLFFGAYLVVDYRYFLDFLIPFFS